MLRARPLAGDMSLGAAVLEDIRPFVYRRYGFWGAGIASVTQGPDPPRSG